jgi:hypothetical protein
LPLRRGAVRPRLRVDTPLELLLEAIVTDRRCRIDRVRDVSIRDRRDEPGLHGVRGPHARIAVGLKLESDGIALRALTVGPDAVERPPKVLDMMSVLVGQDVRLGERSALRPELVGELLEETEVDVDLRVRGTIEGSDLRGRRATGGRLPACTAEGSRPSSSGCCSRRRRPRPNGTPTDPTHHGQRSGSDRRPLRRSRSVVLRRTSHAGRRSAMDRVEPSAGSASSRSTRTRRSGT